MRHIRKNASLGQFKIVEVKIPENMIVELFNERCRDLKLASVSKPRHMVEGFIKNVESCLKDRIFNLRNAQIGPHSTLIVKKMVLHCRELSQLLLGDNNLQDEGLASLCDVIRCTTSIVKLDLSCNGLTSKSAQGLFDALGRNVSIIDLDLSSMGGK